MYFSFLPVLIPHRSMDNPKTLCLDMALSHSLSRSSLFLPTVLSPPLGDGPYSCPETAALHHSQCKSTHTLLLFTPPVSSSVSSSLSLSLPVAVQVSTSSLL